MKKDADLEAINRCLSGDRQAFAVLVERHKAVVYSLARHMLHDASDAEDAAQEAFIRAYSSLKSFRRESSFRSWLCQITNRLCIDKLRTRKYEQGRVALDEIAEPASPEPAEAFVASEQVRMALDRLPDNWRAVLIMRHMEELSYEEIAVSLGLPLGTVKTHLHRARAAFKREFDRFKQEDTCSHNGYEEV